MNITIVSHMFPTPENPAYGIFVLQQAKALSNRGHEITVVSPVPFVPNFVSDLLDRPSSRNIPEQDTYDGITVHYPRYWSLPRPETLPLVAYSFRRTLCNHQELFASADLVNAHVALPDGFGSVPIVQEFNIPLVTTIHGADLQQSINNPFMKRQIKYAIMSSDSIILNSQKLNRIFSEEFNDGPDVEVVYNGVPLEKVGRAEPILNSTSEFKIISVGDLIEIKGHQYTLEAVADFDFDAECIIVGDGPLRNKLENYASELGIKSDVSFTGGVPHERVFSYLKSADVFVLPSYEEAFGVAYIEAMACGLPVIACEDEGPADYITHRETGFLIPPRESEAVSEIIQEIHDNPDLRQYVAERGQRTALNVFSWERNAKYIECIFDRCVKNNPIS